MLAQLQRVEVETAVFAHHYKLAVEHAPLGQLREQRLAQFGEVAQQRLLVAALQVEVVAVTKHHATEAVPLRLEDVAVALGNLARQLREHRLERRLNRQHQSATRSVGGFGVDHRQAGGHDIGDRDLVALAGRAQLAFDHSPPETLGANSELDRYADEIGV